MDAILEFISNYYFIFIIIGVFLIFALIGYLVDSKNIELEKPETVKVDVDTKGNAVEEVETLETLTEVKKEETPTEVLSEAAPTNEVKIEESVKTEEVKPAAETPSTNEVKQ